MIPFYMFSQRELAPAEDQGVVFGVIQSSANSTLDQTNLFTQQVYDVYRAFPESASIFQITNPSGGFGGMVTKPWSQRKKTAQQLLVESTGPLSKIAGVRVIPLTPSPLPGGGNFPVDFVIASSAEPEQLTKLAEQIVQKAMASGLFIYADTDMVTFHVLRAALPLIRKSGSGCIVGIGSRAAVEPGAKVGAYSASKAAMVSLVRTVAEENKDVGITANVILPGTIDTPANRKEMPDADFTKWVQPAKLAALVVFLASDAGKDINGAVIPMYGKA